MRSLTSTTLALVALSLAAACPTLADSTYSFTELAAPAGYHSPKITGMNPSGTIIAGTAVHAGMNLTAAIAWIDGEPTVIADPSGPFNAATANAANDAGVVVGRANHSGFAWSDGEMTLLSGSASVPRALSNTGTIVGHAQSIYKATRWIEAQHEILLPDYSAAFGANDSGAIVGWFKEGWDWRPFLWQDGQWAALPVPGDGAALARAINNAGVIAGHRLSYLPFPVKWEGGEIVHLTDGVPGWARDLNDSGDIVGARFGQPTLAVIWKGGSPDGLHFLNDLVTNLPPGWSLQSAEAVSNTGHIVGIADIGGEERAFLLTPTPGEPGSPGDLNGDGKVGVADLLILLSMWGPCADCTPKDCPADLAGDCNVGVADLLILLGNWG